MRCQPTDPRKVAGIFRGVARKVATGRAPLWATQRIRA